MVLFPDPDSPTNAVALPVSKMIVSFLCKYIINLHTYEALLVYLKCRQYTGPYFSIIKKIIFTILIKPKYSI